MSRLQTIDKTRLCHLALGVIETEQTAIAALSDRINDTFVEACELILACQSRIVVLGMGKSGHIGSKIAATLASTGTPAFFVHPGEASHGDMGMIIKQDVVMAISNSGETSEILPLLPLIKRLNVPLISLTGNPTSTIAQTADVNLDVSVAKEACPFGLAPTASSTATLVMGDALAIALLETKGFTVDDFARSHPGGRLGRRLLLHCGDVMHQGEAIPRVHETALVSEAIVEMTAKKLGMTAVVDHQDRLIGIFTDGDLRRTLDHGADIRTTEIKQVMTTNSKTIHQEMLAAEAVALMEKHKITALPVVENDVIIGILHLHDCLQAGVV